MCYLCEMMKILQRQYIEQKRVIQIFIYVGTLSRYYHEGETLKTLVERAYLIFSAPRLLEKELPHIRTVSRNTNGYPNLIINQEFQHIKVKQRDQLLNSNVSNKNKPYRPVTKQQLKTMMAKKYFLMIPSQEVKQKKLLSQKNFKKSIIK